jgi:hypothetical protein
MGNSINSQRQHYIHQKNHIQKQQQHIQLLQQQLKHCQRQRRNTFGNGNINANLENYSSYMANGGTPYTPDPIGYAQHSTYTTTGRTSPYGYTTDWGSGVSNIQSGGGPQIMRTRT